ncbi:MAG TPA: hypothetical protein VFK69_07920, partial [Candidatus Eisenbacteria bacterium]|nr:hypothetical protein [Candidatus Eisenbacteria bacterium]
AAFHVPAGLAHPLGLGAALLAAALVHAPAVRTFFAQDDATFLSRAAGIEGTPWSFARPLSEAITWRALYAAFGLHPLPYHVFLLALHLTATALVWWIGLALLGGPGAATAAATLFGASSIAFTPLHWTSGLVELESTTLALACFALWLGARRRGSASWMAGAALAMLAAVLAKESVLLLPLVLLAAERVRASGAPDAPRARAVWPVAAAVLVWGAAFTATIGRVKYLGVGAYTMTADPGFLATNVATYLEWLLRVDVPIRDIVATADSAAWGAAAAMAALIALAVWLDRREPRRPAWVGLAWFGALLLPVVPLSQHTYLYYLYAPWAGMSWLLASLGQRLARAGRLAARAALVLVVAFVALEARQVRERERAMSGDFAADRTVRESTLLRNAMKSLAASGAATLPAGTPVAFVTPAPVRTSMFSPAGAGEHHVYVPLEAALRGGETLRLFHPNLRMLGFADSLPPAWESAEVYQFDNDGTLRDQGRGARALANLGYFALRQQRLEQADAMFRRSRALGDTLPDATFGLIITNSARKDDRAARAVAAEFLRRWPNDPRAATVRQGLAHDTTAAR